jgi:hypothetical protein
MRKLTVKYWSGSKREPANILEGGGKEDKEKTAAQQKRLFDPTESGARFEREEEK